MTTVPRPLELPALVAASVELLEAHQAPGGAFPASPSFPVYRFSWFRDGAFVADALSRAGRVEAAERFHAWCARVLAARRARVDGLVADRRAGVPIAPERFLPCRYTLDGEEERGDWWDFQLDGYGTWLWALAGHARRHGRPVAAYRAGVETCVRYLAEFWDEPCYDWWEENAERRHTSTLAAVYAGLAAVGHPVAAQVRERTLAEGVRGGRLVKWLGGDALDASLVACATPFGLVEPDDPRMAATVAALEAELAHGGVHRYAADTYYGGGEWLLLAALLGWHYLEVGRRADAEAQLEWVAAQATEAGELPEQVDAHLLAPQRKAEWVERWGPSACPLLWSHAMLVTLAVELGAAAGARR